MGIRFGSTKSLAHIAILGTLCLNGWKRTQLFPHKANIWFSNAFPTTTIVLPLKHDKVKPVKEELSSIHPEVLLFLSKIKRFSVREQNKKSDPILSMP
ncbi:hypothetical protein SLA2020_274740 [Shorea laevis]